MTLPGQSGIRLRAALAAGDAAAALALLPGLDEPHRIELLLGAALRDQRDDWAAARAFLDAEVGGDWAVVCAHLAAPGADTTLDDLAAAYVAEGRAPEAWHPEGDALDGPVRALPAVFPDVAVAAALQRGVAGLALLDVFADLPLYAATAHYYRRGTLHALGCRPLLVLAASAP